MQGHPLGEQDYPWDFLQQRLASLDMETDFSEAAALYPRE